MAKRPSRAKRWAKDSMSIAFTPNFRALAELAENTKKALRPAAYAGARILYDEMLDRVFDHIETGALFDSIYHYHDENQSSENRHVYVIGPNKSKAPHWHFLEYGTSRQPAQPYVRPTWDSKGEYAMMAAMNRFAELLKQNATQSVEFAHVD